VRPSSRPGRGGPVAQRGASPALERQRRAGNHAIGVHARAAAGAKRRMVATAADPAEREADRLADEVTRPAAAGHALEAERMPAAAVRERPPEPVAAKAASGVGGGPAAALPVSLPAGGGSALGDAERAPFERGFGRSLAGVRIHADAAAEAATAAVGARALTAGDDIFFARGQYRPQTQEGRRLLAHELTHTVQQRQAGGTPAAAQADFWDTVGRGWDLYWGLDDEGAPFARDLMEHYLLGFGTDFDVTPASDPDWNRFMLDRPEIQRAMRPVLEQIALDVAGQGETEQPWIRFGAGPTVTENVTGVRLNELESMRLTLHGAHRIEVEVNYDVTALEGGGFEVVFRRIKMVWVDRGDMHAGVGTELDTGEVVEDEELTGAGAAYDIYIWFQPFERTVYRVSGGSATQQSGWPPTPGASAPGGERG
jgi:hypothetical protein